MQAPSLQGKLAKTLGPNILSTLDPRPLDPKLPYELKSKLLKAGSIGDCIGEYYRGYYGGY